MKIYKLLLSIMLLFVFACSTSFALSSIQNVAVVGDEISWDAFDGADKYIFLLGNLSFQLPNTNTSVSGLSEYAKTYGFRTGTYDLVLYAVDSNLEAISNTWTGQFSYESDVDPLSTPTNLKWNGKVASWDSVTNADHYYINVAKGTDVIVKQNVYGTSLDLSSNASIEYGYNYSFCVKAYGEGYPYSDFSEWCATFLKDPSNNVTDIPNVSLSGSSLSWGHYGRSNIFKVKLDQATYTVTNQYSIDLDTIASYFGYSSGSYTVQLFAVDEDKTTVVSKVWSSSYNYVNNNPKLNAPTNIRWDGLKARWNSVSGASSYVVYIFRDGETTSYSSEQNITNTYFDFSSTGLIDNTHKFRFGVVAYSDTNPHSDLSELSAYYYNGVVLGDIQDISFSLGIISWSAYSDADDYLCYIDSTPIHTNGATSINVFNYIGNDETSVQFKVTAYKNNKEISNTYSATYTFTRLFKGDLDGDRAITIIDVRLLLQMVINSGDSTSWTPTSLAIMDMDLNDKINIIDVRFLLQDYINNQ